MNHWESAWDNYVGQFDTYGDEWQDKRADQIFKAGYEAALAVHAEKAEADVIKYEGFLSSATAALGYEDCAFGRNGFANIGENIKALIAERDELKRWLKEPAHD